MHIGEPQPPPDEPDPDGPAWLLSKAWARAELVIWGAHGGAGATTLATWLQPAWDMGPARPGPASSLPGHRRRRPAADHRLPVHGPVRSRGDHRRGRGHQGRQPGRGAGDRQRRLARASAATARFRLLEPQAGPIVRVPFVPGLRLVDDPASAALPRRAVRALDQIRVATGGARHIR